MAVQEAMSAFGPAWIARSFQTSWRAAGTIAHTKIEVSVNAYAVFKVQRVNSPLTKETARFFVQNDTIFLIVHKKLYSLRLVVELFQSAESTELLCEGQYGCFCSKGCV